MAEFSYEVRDVFRKGTIARTSILDAEPSAERVDGYTASTYKSQLDAAKLDADKYRQKQRENATELKTVTDNWLMIHDSARDPDMMQDIIDEASNQLSIINRNNAKAEETPPGVVAVANKVEALGKKIGVTIADKDKVIDAELTAASKEEEQCGAKVDEIDALLKELYKKRDEGTGGSGGTIGKIVDTVKGTGGDKKEPDPELEQKIREAEADLKVAQKKLADARERKRQAVANGLTRDNAKASNPVGAANKAHTDVLSWKTQSDNFLALWKAYGSWLTTYQANFQKVKTDPSAANKKTLEDYLKKVDDLVVKLKALQAGLVDGSRNL